MTSKEALERLVKQANARKLSNEIVVNRWDYEKLLELAERDTPKRAGMRDYNGDCNWEYECPVCKMYLFAGENYCSSCGQRLDWSIFDE